MLDVPLDVYNAVTKSYRETVTYDGPFLDVHRESARGAIGEKMVLQRRQISPAAQFDMGTKMRENAAVKTHVVVVNWSSARVVGSRSHRPRLSPSGAGIKIGSTHLAQLRKSSLCTVSNRGLMPEIAAAIEEATELKALPERELVEDERQRSAIGSQRNILGAGEAGHKIRPDAAQ